jgi:antitoxin component YwqK of YwqJK toxin-antitoxin module
MFPLFQMKHVLTIIYLFFSINLLAQNYPAQDTTRINFIDENGLKQGQWVYTNAEKKLPGYRDDQLVEEGYFKDNLRNGIWKKYYENGNLEWELTFVGNRPNGYAIFYYRNGKVSEEGVWKNNRWVGEYKYFHENGKLKYEWKYNASGKREGAQKYYYENGQLMIIGSWDDGKEAGELKEFFSNGDLRAVKYFNNGDIAVDSTKVFPKPEGLIDDEPIVRDDKKDEEKKDTATTKDTIADKDTIIMTANTEQKDTTHILKYEPNNNHSSLGFFDGNGYYKLTDKNGKLTREGDFKNGFLMNGKVYRYDANGNIEKTIVYKEGKVVEEIDGN